MIEGGLGVEGEERRTDFYVSQKSIEKHRQLS